MEDPLKLLIAVLDCYFVQQYETKNDKNLNSCFLYTKDNFEQQQL